MAIAAVCGVYLVVCVLVAVALPIIAALVHMGALFLEIAAHAY
ncbi:hypothetical protein QN345_00450 [Cryobacterium sp. 10I1]|nr:hypothetical protein [Cryobacterium sp. 10I1]MEB0303809.1 hypothetical protein [Cryobacterium sp. 10I1]